LEKKEYCAQLIGNPEFDLNERCY